MPHYLLSAHVYVCIADEYAVFLDLIQDKYSALEPAAAHALSDVIQGWACTATRDVESALSARDCDELVHTLLEERLVTDDPTAGKRANPVSLVRPSMALQPLSRQPNRVDTGQMWNFAAAWLTTATMLRTVPLRFVVARAKERKARKHPTTSPFDVDKSAKLMAAYSILQPKFFSRKNACLRDSMTVVEFLSRYEMFPTWVFGVSMNPFAAHSWVQEGSVVLNDAVDNVNAFTPIMTI